MHGILALNPATEAAGYPPPDLRAFSQRSWSLHTYSAYDTLQEISDGDVLLETPLGETELRQHTSGVTWLAGRLEVGDESWLTLEMTLPERTATHFRGLVTMDGQLSDIQHPRKRPDTRREREPSAPEATTQVPATGQ